MKEYPKWIKTKSHRMLHDDFRVFLWYIWRHLGLLPPTEIQNDIATYIQSGPRRRIIKAFRGVGKSWITAAFVLWLLYREPQYKILIVSASKDRADAFSIFCKRLIADVDILDFLAPGPDQRDSNIAFDVGPATPDQAPSVKSVGITSQITGSHADYIISDDVEVPNNSMTEDQREKLAIRTSEFDAILNPGGHIVCLGTPQCAQSLYNLLRDRGYSPRVWPARYTDGINPENHLDSYDGCLAPWMAKKLQADPSLMGTSTEPSRFDEEDLREREQSYGRSGFALQFMLDTSLSDANRYPLKITDMIVMDLNRKVAPVQLTWAGGFQQAIEGIPNIGLNGDRLNAPMYISEAHVDYQGSVMFIDPSGRGKDECAYAVVKMLNGLLYCTAWSGIKGTGYDDEALNALALIAKDHDVNEIQIESNFGDGMFNALFAPVLKRVHPCTLEDFNVQHQKELRIIQKLEPILNQHRLVMDTSVCRHNSEVDAAESGARSGLFQLSHLTKERGSLKFDDRIDILASACGYWTERLDVDNKDADEAWKLSEKHKALDEFAKRILGKRRGRGLGPVSGFKNYMPDERNPRKKERSVPIIM